MNKATSFLLILLNLILVGGFVFVALEVNELHLQKASTSITSQSDNLGKEVFIKEIEKIKLDLADHKAAIGTLSEKLDKLASNLKDGDSASTPTTKFSVEKTLFVIDKLDAEVLLVTGYQDPLKRWLKDNSALLPQLLAGSLSAAFNESTQVIEIKSIATGSYFAQMGLAKGDIVQLIDGKVPTSVDELMAKLTSVEPVNISLKRGEKNLTFKLSYDSMETGEVTLDFSTEQFRGALARIFASLRLAPVVQNGKMAGVKILETDAQGVFNAMGFQKQDVITDINQVPVMLKGFQDRLLKENFPLDIKFQREGTERVVTVKLNS